MGINFFFLQFFLKKTKTFVSCIFFCMRIMTENGSDVGAMHDNLVKDDSMETDDVEEQGPSLKFGLNLAASFKNKQRLKGKVQLDDQDENAGEAISAVARNGGVVPVEAKKEEIRVVPLLDANGNIDASKLEQAAVQSLLSGESAQLATQDSENPVVVPMLLKGRINGIEEFENDDQKFKYDVDNRPDAPNLSTYESMPVEMIGEAMLRGMGWTPGTGVGKNKQVFDPIVLVKRPGRLGLGAKLQQVLPPTHGKKRTGPVKQGESREPTAQMGALNADGSFRSRVSANESLVPLKLRQFEQGVRVAIVGGRHAGLFGRIEEMRDNNTRASVRLGSDELVTVDKTQLEFRDKYEQQQEEKKQSKKRAADDIPSSKRRKKSSSSSSTSNKKPMKLWIRPNIMVRIVSKKFKEGRFYEKKARIVDCIGGDLCTLELNDGRVLDQVKQSHLENVVGRKNQRVMILNGKEKGQLGTVLQRDAKTQACLVQLDSTMDAHKMSYDDVALFCGTEQK